MIDLDTYRLRIGCENTGRGKKRVAGSSAQSFNSDYISGLGGTEQVFSYISCLIFCYFYMTFFAHHFSALYGCFSKRTLYRI